MVLPSYGGLAKHIMQLQCEEICKDELEHNTNFTASSFLDKVWPEWRTASEEYQAYVYFLVDPRNADDIPSNCQSFKKDILYVGEFKKDGRIDHHHKKYNHALTKGDLLNKKSQE
uniref:BAH domain-containing protein n=1 Tax=Rhabditophanes sp. KR3021 TaxID=114890 RepID=A0AC35TQK8_9BILA